MNRTPALDGIRVLDLASVGPAARASRALADYGAEVVAIVAQADTAAWAEVPAQLIATPDVPDVLSPLVQVIPLQLFAYHLAAAKGRNPDRPMGFDNATLQRLVYAAQLPGWDAP